MLEAVPSGPTGITDANQKELSPAAAPRTLAAPIAKAVALVDLLAFPSTPTSAAQSKPTSAGSDDSHVPTVLDGQTNDGAEDPFEVLCRVATEHVTLQQEDQQLPDGTDTPRAAKIKVGTSMSRLKHLQECISDVCQSSGQSVGILLLQAFVDINRLFLDDSLRAAEAEEVGSSPPTGDAKPPLHRSKRRRDGSRVSGSNNGGSSRGVETFEVVAQRLTDVILPKLAFRSNVGDLPALITRHMLRPTIAAIEAEHGAPGDEGAAPSSSSSSSTAISLSHRQLLDFAVLMDSNYGTQLQKALRLSSRVAPEMVAGEHQQQRSLSPAMVAPPETLAGGGISPRTLSPVSEVSAACFSASFPCARSNKACGSISSGADPVEDAVPTVQSIVEKLRLPPPPSVTVLPRRTTALPEQRGPATPPKRKALPSSQDAPRSSGLSAARFSALAASFSADASKPQASLGSQSRAHARVVAVGAPPASRDQVPSYLLRKRANPGNSAVAPAAVLPPAHRNDNMVLKPTVHRTTCLSSPYMSRTALRDCSNGSAPALLLTTVPKTPPPAPKPKTLLFDDDDDDDKLDFVPASPQ